MLIVTTRPFDALISLNGKATKYKTSFHLLPTIVPSLAPGWYDLQISKKGYRTWKDRLEVRPNMVTWVNYVLLFPEKLNISKISTPTGSAITKSKSGRHILFAGGTEKFELKSADTNNLSVKDFWPTTAPTEPWLVSPVITTAQYSVNNDKALLRIANEARTEFVVSDAGSNQAKLIHLNNTLKQDLTGAWWNVGNNNELYVQTAAGISLVNINDTSVSAPILTDFVSFEVDDSKQILYAAKSQAGIYSVNRMNLDGSNKAVLVDSILPAAAYRLGYSSANSLLTVLNADTKELTAYYVGNTTKKYSIMLSSGVNAYSWSKDGQYLFYFGKDFVKRYDWIRTRETDAKLLATPTDVEWYFDENHYLITNAEGSYVMDLDGSNVVPITGEPASMTVMDQGTSSVIYTSSNPTTKGVFYKFIPEF